MDIGNKVLKRIKNRIISFERFEEIMALKKISNHTCKARLKYSDEKEEREGTIVIGLYKEFVDCSGRLITTKDHYTFFFDEPDNSGITHDNISKGMLNNKKMKDFYNYYIEYIII